jgi:hypothetical protein
MPNKTNSELELEALAKLFSGCGDRHDMELYNVFKSNLEKIKRSCLNLLHELELENFLRVRKIYSP